MRYNIAATIQIIAIVLMVKIVEHPREYTIPFEIVAGVLWGIASLLNQPKNE